MSHKIEILESSLNTIRNYAFELEFNKLKRQKKTRKSHWRYIPKSGRHISDCQKCHKPGYLYFVMNFDGSITARVSHSFKTTPHINPYPPYNIINHTSTTHVIKL